jgi:predicted nucleic acid-binding protein
MSGNKIVLDTNVIIYLLNGDQTLRSFFEDKLFYISVINELELLGFSSLTNSEFEKIDFFLEECSIIELNSGIKNIVVDLRRKYSIKLPDAIIAATAIFLNIPLISADKHFEKINELTFVLYQP